MKILNTIINILSHGTYSKKMMEGDLELARLGKQHSETIKNAPVHLHCPKCSSTAIKIYDTRSRYYFCAKCGYISQISNPTSGGEDSGFYYL